MTHKETLDKIHRMDLHSPASSDLPLVTGSGVEWVVEAFGCAPETLQDRRVLSRIFRAAVRDLGLTPVGRCRWHRFPGPGGLTGFWLLAESHLACHSFPEFGSVCFNLFCCRPRPAWAWRAACRELLGAERISVRRLERFYGDRDAG